MSGLFDFAMLAYLLSGVFFVVEGVTRWRVFRVLGYFLQIMGLVLGGVLIAKEWVASGYPPMRNMYESLTLMAHCLVLIHLVQAMLARFPLMRPLSGFGAALLMAWASSAGGPSEHTLPALQNSFWLSIHVFLSMAAYAAVMVAAVSSLFHIMASSGVARFGALFTFSTLLSGGLAGLAVKLLTVNQMVSFEGPTDIGLTVVASAFVGGAVLVPLFYYLFRPRLFPALENDHKLAGFVHTIAMIALPLMTLSIITGSIWGDVAWGRYWGWDPKEVWALITWLSLIAYAHLRLPGSRFSSFAPWVLVIGFVTVLFNYFGVNFLLRGLHSYA